jgi:hypothetical protein
MFRNLNKLFSVKSDQSEAYNDGDEDDGGDSGFEVVAVRDSK